jgi:2-iminobutanoate/2-iminopropanoate deaminase
MVQIQRIEVSNMPPANLTYSQAVRVQDLILVSGQIGIDFETGRLVGDDVAAQTKQLLENTKCVLEAAGSSLDRVVKTTIFITDLNDLEKMNEMLLQYINSRPAKTVAIVSSLYGFAKVEMDFMAI